MCAQKMMGEAWAMEVAIHHGVPHRGATTGVGLGLRRLLVGLRVTAPARQLGILMVLGRVGRVVLT